MESDNEFVDRVTKYDALTSKEEDARLNALARKGAEAGKLLAEQTYEYNRKTNALIARHAKTTATLRAELERKDAEKRQLREVIDRWRDATMVIPTLNGPRFVRMDESRAKEAWDKTRAALSPAKKEGGA